MTVSGGQSVNVMESSFLSAPATGAGVQCVQVIGDGGPSLREIRAEVGVQDN